jgi:hypothetical protein
MRIRLTVGEASATARLYDNATARDFRVPAAGDDHRARPGRPGESGGAAARTHRRAWAEREPRRSAQLLVASKDLALYYHEDGFRITGPGIVMIGEIESGLDAITGAATTCADLTSDTPTSPIRACISDISTRRSAPCVV